MIMNERLLIITLIGLLLMIAPVSAEMVTAKVDDKGLMYYHSEGIVGTLHTPYGWIIVTDEDYNNIMVNDTIRYDTKKDTFWHLYWTVEVVT